MIEKLTVSQCTNSSYCTGYNDAVGLANEQIEELSAKLKAVCDELEELKNSIPEIKSGAIRDAVYDTAERGRAYWDADKEYLAVPVPDLLDCANKLRSE